MTTIITSPSPDPEAIRILGTLVPHPREYDSILPMGAKSAYLLVWRVVGNLLSGEEILLGTQREAERIRQRVIVPAAYQLRQLGWDVKLGFERKGERGQAKASLVVRPTDRASKITGQNWCYAPTPSQMELLSREQNRALAWMVWLFVQAIAEGHGLVELGNVDTMRFWVGNDALRIAKDIVIRRGWTMYSIRSRATERSKERVCLKLVPNYTGSTGEL